MFSFFSTVVDFFAMIWDFVSNLLSGMVTAMEVLLKAVALPPLLVGFVPSIIASSMLIVGSVGMVKLIVGWGNK